METLRSFNQQLLPNDEKIAIQIQADVKFFKETIDLKWSLSFKVQDPSQVIIWNPKSTPMPKPSRADLLWQKTCFEIFFRSPKQKEYFEVNLNELGQWNIYRFDSYRKPTPPIPVSEAILTYFEYSENQSLVNAEMTIKDFFTTDSADHLDVNLTAVLKLTQSLTSYWAFKHADPQPDFHHQDCFTLKRKIYGV